MAREELVSTLLGYTSIACWLCAQFPQMIYTWRRKSVEGLALSLLANWLLGDTTNLIGCILTDQLPFQTHLAAYFVFIDICLVTQFLYYDGQPRHHATSISVVKSSQSSSVPHQSQTSPLLEAQPFRSHVSHSLDPGAAVTNVTRAPSELDYEHEGSTSAEVDDGHGSQRRRWRSRGSRRATSSMGLPENFAVDPWERHWVTRRYISLERDRDGATDEANDAESESSPAVLGESVHPEGRGRARGRDESSGRDNSHVSRRESHGELLDEGEPWRGTAPSTGRGRPLTRTNVHHSPVVIGDAALDAARRSAMPAVSEVASRRSAGLVFLAVFALFSFTSSSLGIIRRSAGSEGRVLNIVPRSMPDGTSLSSFSTYSAPLSTATAPRSPVARLGSDVVGLVIPSEDIKLIIGRVSAWTCTTLYMTSRLPQIWKNFVRKSVEGASMYLFIFAFLGNFFYVLSIVTNPKMDLPEPQASQFIRDSVPYILGSGGTLLLDVTILSQSLVYDPRRRLLRSRKGRWKKSLLVGGAGEEERRMLLEADRRVEDAC